MDAAASFEGSASPGWINHQHLAHDLDEGVATRAAIGLVVLASDNTIEYEFRKLLDLEGVACFQARIPNSPEVTQETLKAMESQLAATSDLILPGGQSMDVIAYGCTSASMLIGPSQVEALIQSVRPKSKVTNPMSAACAALEALAVKRLALLTPYREDINLAMRRFMLEAGFEVPVMGSFNEGNDNVAARISPRSIHQAALRLASADDVEGVFVSCTSLRLAEVAASIERDLGKPVTSSNHALAWHCLRLAGIEDSLPHWGRLFTLPLG